VTAVRALFFELLSRVAPSLSLCITTSSALRGRAGERLAARHLRRAGHLLLARNLRHPRGELDLVTRVGPHLVVVEVKTGLTSRAPLSARFSPSARLRRRLAAAELARRWDLSPRLDLVEVLLSEGGRVTRIHHTRDL
jgi:putative endonuclease